MTPEQLRELERSMAFEHATGLIEGMCLKAVQADDEDEVNGWWDLSTSDVDLGDEAEYLESRGLVERHAANPDWIVLRDEDEPLVVQA